MISKLKIAKDKWNSNKSNLKYIKNSIYDYILKKINLKEFNKTNDNNNNNLKCN